MNIRQERNKRGKGWTLEYVASKVGVTKATIHDIEVGRRKPSYQLYCALMSLFGYEVPRLVFGEADGEISNLNE